MAERFINFEILRVERPYLESPLNLYERVYKFLRECDNIEGSSRFIDEVLEKFHNTFEIPFEFISFLKEIIKNNERILFDDPASLREILFIERSLEEEIKRLLFYIKLPFFRLMAREKREFKTDESKNKCLICGEFFSLSMIDEENKRYMICSICGSEKEIFRIGCSYCLHRDCEKIDILVDEDEVRVELCKECKTYIKSFKKTSDIYLKYPDPNLIDIISLPLDVVAQKRGFIRRSPNILGIREIR